jgi:hypothetical protein
MLMLRGGNLRGSKRATLATLHSRTHGWCPLGLVGSALLVLFRFRPRPRFSWRIDALLFPLHCGQALAVKIQKMAGVILGLGDCVALKTRSG